LHAGLNNVERVIVQVEVDRALSDAVILIWVFDYRLEKVSLEVEDL